MATVEFGDASPPNVHEGAEFPVMAPLYDLSNAAITAGAEPTEDASRAYLARTMYVIGVEL